MTRIFLTLFALICCILLPCYASAAVVTVGDRDDMTSLNGKMDVLMDSTGKLTIEEVADPVNSGRFKALDKRLNIGYTKDAVWLRFTLQKADESVSDERWLEIFPPLTDNLNLYIPKAGGSFIEKKSGDWLPLSTRDIEAANFVFRIMLTGTGPHTYYLRVQTTSTVLVDAKLWAPEHFNKAEFRMATLQGIFYGVICLLIVLNVFFWFILKDRLYLIYTFFLVAWGVSIMPLIGYMSLFIFPESPAPANFSSGIMIPMVLVSGSLLIEALIPLEKRHWLRRSMSAVRFLSYFAFFMILTGKFEYVAALMQFTGLYLASTCIIMSLVGIHRRVPSAVFYSITFAVYYVGSILLTIRNTNIFGLSRPFMDWPFQIGLAIHMILIQIAIANRFRSVEIKGREAQQNALDTAKQSERELERKAREWANTFDSISDMILIINRDFRIIKANKAALAFMEKEPGNITGMKCNETGSYCKFEAGDSCPCLEVFGADKPVTREFYDSDRDMFFEVSISPIHNMSGDIVAVVHTTKDVTWRKRMELEILKTQKLESISVLAGGIAHDFNNMLTIIMSTVTLAKMQAGDNEVAVETLREAEGEIIRARELTRQLLTFSKDGSPMKMPADISALLKETVEFSIKGSAVDCTILSADDLWPADIDRVQISQVISNLVINATQAMPEGGVLDVNAENVVIDEEWGLPVSAGRYVKISIKDAGIGIPHENISRIFDPFFTTKPGGSGLGLASSFSIIVKHGGHISVRSKAGEGSEFEIYLPASADSYAETEPLVDIDSEGMGKVIVMEDDETVRKGMAEFLKSIGN